ncbi:MAG: hypothetical protein BGO98_21980 [Myxococcales bacterium 68-20]|nr:hypothetical protein [Myxococcales bacterium]OJY15124.1 MAG: hypothetical protein BGO98_21980 [Myxococcales bacterium 68-20]
MFRARIRSILLALSNAGCGVSILASYPADIPFLRAHNETSIGYVPLAPPQTSARYTLASAPLRVVCDTETVVPRMARTKQATFDGAQRTVVGFMAVAETAIMIMFPGRHAVETGDAASWTGAAILQADALFAAGYAIFAPSREDVRQDIVQGVPERTGTCPPGILVQTGNQSLPVDPWGRLPGGTAAAGWVVDFGASISVGGRVATWTPTPSDRCLLAQESGHPLTPSICGVGPARLPPAPPPPSPSWPSATQWNGSISFP